MPYVSLTSCTIRPASLTPADQVRYLDILADIELQRGHHAAAEQLANLAAEMREDGR
jgi:hypothetical protein